MIYTSYAPVRCGIVLAAGDGKRLQSFVRQLRGTDLPKQYVNFIGTRSLLEHTFDRVGKVISSDRLFTVVSREHLRHPEATEQLSSRPGRTVIIQPANRETGPGLLLPLMHVFRRYPQSTVAVFPSDHFIAEEDLFMAHVLVGFWAVERDPAKIVLLGIKPNQPEVEYGYIVPEGGAPEPGHQAIHGVRTFVEKPSIEAARELVSRGALWNTMVMVFKVETFLNLTRIMAPPLYRSFEKIWDAIGTSQERFVVEDVYREMDSLNLSRDLLESFVSQSPGSLAVLRVDDVFWSDWGAAARIFATMKDLSRLDVIHGDFIRSSRICNRDFLTLHP